MNSTLFSAAKRSIAFALFAGLMAASVPALADPSDADRIRMHGGGGSEVGLLLALLGAASSGSSHSVRKEAKTTENDTSSLPEGGYSTESDTGYSYCGFDDEGHPVYYTQAAN